MAPMDGLFDRNRDIDETLLRNIVSLRTSQDLFDDLIETPEERDVLVQAEMRIKGDISPGVIARGFHYTTAIGYPFTTQPFMLSRYGNGTYPVWYGSLDLDTTIHETAWHMHNELLAIDGLNEIVIRERAVYEVDCCAVLLDLTGKTTEYPALTDNDYAFTQQVGHRVQGEGHPGLLAPSARKMGGTNAVIFKEHVLDNPRNLCYLTYHFDPMNARMRVERTPGRAYITIDYSHSPS